MNNQELRIGNAVLSYGVGYYIERGEDLEWLEFEPIPITEEWLLMMGFIDEEPHLILTINGFELLYYQYNLDKQNPFRFSMCDREIKIEYVHQLQNLYFALTGKELISA